MNDIIEAFDNIGIFNKSSNDDIILYDMHTLSKYHHTHVEISSIHQISDLNIFQKNNKIFIKTKYSNEKILYEQLQKNILKFISTNDLIHTIPLIDEYIEYVYN